MKKGAKTLSKKDYKIILVCIILLALVVRLIYVIKMPFTARQHDLDVRYIWTIYETGHIPETNAGQFYHPPFHQMICGTIMKIESIFNKDLTIEDAWESFQFVTLIYSMILFRSYIQNCKRIKAKEKIYTFYNAYSSSSSYFNNFIRQCKQ